MKKTADKKTEFGQFNILKIGKVYVQSEMIGTLKNYQVRLIKNEALINVKIGDVAFLKVEDQSTTTQYGTDLKFLPIRLITDQAEIEEYIMLDRQRVSSIFINAAQENLAKGWYSGDAISKALIFCASHPTLKSTQLELRSKRLENIVEAAHKYEYKETKHFSELCELAISIFKDEQNLNEINLEKFEPKIKKIQRDLKLANKSIQEKNEADIIQAQNYLNQLKQKLDQKT
ncbi:hypothetical protein [Acinetobacter guillouiae]|uniref:hypothetical protein n=1 Tax=Acinetobacter guillouiae TaxID=106649 RepID=UPI002E1DF72D